MNKTAAGAAAAWVLTLASAWCWANRGDAVPEPVPVPSEEAQLEETVDRLMVEQVMRARLAELEGDFQRDGYRADLIREMYDDDTGRARQGHGAIVGSRDLSTRWFDTRLRREWDLVNAGLKRQFGDGVCAALARDLAPTFESRREALVRAEMGVEPGTLFGQARAEAIRRQQIAANQAAYPRFDQVQRFLDPDDCIAAVGGRIGASTVFQDGFAEVRGVVTANAVCNDIFGQRSAQEEVIATLDPREGQRTAEDIEAELRARLDERLSLDRGKEALQQTGRTLYGLWATTEERTRSRAAELEGKRFESYLTTNFSASLPEAEVLVSDIRQDLKGHRTMQASVALLVDRYHDSVGRQALEQYLQFLNSRRVEDGAGPLGDRAGALRVRLQALLGNRRNVGAGQRLDEAVARSLQSPRGGDHEIPVEKARSILATEQSANYFGPLERGDWVVPEQVVNELASGKRTIETLADFLGLKIENVTYDGQPLLTETEARVVDKGTSALEYGKSTRNKQLGLVDTLKEPIKNQWDAAPRAGDPAREEDDWVKRYTEEVTQQWQREDPGIVGRYPKLFDEPRARIKLIVHEFYTVARPPPPPPEPVVRSPPSHSSTPVESKAQGGGPIEAATHWLVGLLNELKDWLGGLWDGFGDWLKGIFGSGGGGAGPGVGTPKPGVGEPGNRTCDCPCAKTT